jgi:hypothetical protein
MTAIHRLIQLQTGYAYCYVGSCWLEGSVRRWASPAHMADEVAGEWLHPQR